MQPSAVPAIHTKCACIRARRAARALTDVYDRALEGVGLKITQFSVLRTAARLEPVSVSALAEEMALDRSTLGRNLAILRRRGLIADAEASDLRERAVKLTPAAHRVLARALPLWESAQKTVERALGKNDVATLYDLLARLEVLP
jgi:DNA-binding MarR family transcriptional regulator